MILYKNNNVHDLLYHYEPVQRIINTLMDHLEDIFKSINCSFVAGPGVFGIFKGYSSISIRVFMLVRIQLSSVGLSL